MCDFSWRHHPLFFALLLILGCSGRGALGDGSEGDGAEGDDGVTSSAAALLGDDLGGDLSDDLGGDFGDDMGGVGGGPLEVQWSPDLVLETLSPGETQVLTVQFTATQNADSVHFDVSPELQDFITIVPSDMPSVEAWVSYPLELHVTVPDATPNMNATGYVSMYLDDAADPLGDPLGGLGLGGDLGGLGSDGVPLPLMVDLTVDAFTIHITSPESLITVGSFPIPVTGTVSSAAATVTVNGIEVPNVGGTFSASVALEEGHNTVLARAVEGGKQATDSISVSLDLTPPYVTVESHVDGQTVHTDKITVTGLINDIVRGTVEESQVEVSVNGLPATVSNRSYSVADVPLVLGDNLITVTGTDQVGNVGTVQFTVRYVALAGKHLELVSGQGQSGQISSELGAPFVIRVVGDDQQPVPNTNVVFRVTQGAGVLEPDSAGEARAAAVVTDVNGLAAARFKLGTRSGTANQKVRAKVVGYDDEIVFYASALPNIGNKISVNSGNNQRGSIGQVLPEPFVVVVTDDGANVVQGARVQFEVTRGEGLLQTGAATFITQTDSDGRATSEYVLGPLSGIDAQRVTATLLDAPPGAPPINAGFMATAFVSGNPGQTSISGVVLDNQDNPLPGVTVRVDGTSRQATTDAQGQFRITEAPVGAVHLIADGSTASGGEYPSLSYNLVTIPGVDNPLSAPVYMVKLDTDSSVFAGPADVTLELPSYPGFKLEIAAGSVTFPDGAQEGHISVTPVNASKVPMAPPNGMQPQFIVTIQPTGTRFDPPAKLTLPNVDGHAPGTQAEMYSYDHDLEEFVSIGLGTVSEDGTVITSNPGVGVIKAGWHCGSQPTGQGCAHNCPVCQDCDGNCNCVPANGDPRAAAQDQPGDCSRPECQGGSVTQVPDDGDVPPDQAGDCQVPMCQNGAPSQSPDDSDVPSDTTAGDCQMPQCQGGVLGQGPDDSDAPTGEPCKECSGGAVANKPDGNHPTPGASAGPGATQVGWGPAWGANKNFGYDLTTQCQTMCIGGVERTAIVGDITPKASWVVEVTTILRAAGCAQAPRTAANIQRTTTHELRHTAYLMSVINGAKAGIGADYATPAECNTALTNLTTTLQTDWNAMVTRQGNHTDFSGETQYCESCVGGVSVEVACGAYP